MSETLQHKFADVNGIRLHYAEQGEGDLIILLHGWPEFWYCWRKQIPELAKHYHVVAPDLRGFNESDKPSKVSEYKIETVTKDIVELIEKTGHTKATVIAHDWGGAVGYELGMNYPEKLNKLIIMNSPHPSVMKKQLMTNPKQRKRSSYMFLFQIPLLPELFMKLTLRKTFTKSFRGWAYNKEQFPDDVIEEYVKAFSKKGAMRGGLNWYRAAFRSWKEDNKKEKKPVSVQTLIIWGENDKALGKELTYDLDKYFSAPFEIKYIPKCSHWVQNEYPELVNQYILKFMNK